MKLSNRLNRVPKYIFSRLDELKTSYNAKGIKVIDLSIGDPDIETPEFIVDYLTEALKYPNYHKYPPYDGIEELKMSIANYYKRRFNVDLDYKDEVAVLIGSKEGIAHMFLALTDIDDYVIIPDPAYPVYRASAYIAGCNVYTMPLTYEDKYLPRLENIYEEVKRKAKLLVTNYPNNPTGAVSNIDFFTKLIKFGKENDILIANDAAYVEILSNAQKPLSILQVAGAKDIAIEFGSLSKLFSMTGWRIGYVVGNKEAISKIVSVKSNFDSGQFIPIQRTAAFALDFSDVYVDFINDIYRERRKIVVDTLRSKNLTVFDSEGTFYVWFKIPDNYKSEEFCTMLLEKAHVLITPGNAFGDRGEGFVRISLTCNSLDLREAMDNIKAIDF
ncbi:aminotransferase class I/II-fold pyridoxal phosphate-dependent enzyme [Caloramator proteoclasticus]|uniref:Aminotransferase n=1 Tax=Caloramator proteoclasticus DSM 10124 TaxID=1121262 RepID=A0A1M5AMM5_9CLOT|nr:aminotransferase class I/II-fold pyridoxal phosphate-dependent enzyme [Caloramator proteoclasticus]SHF31520.1 LL-diaminopimelate aminotransferase apoenzyme [Caloramator proteoclasticus DSM 10124]